MIFLDVTLKAQVNKQVGPRQTKKLLHSKRNYLQNEKQPIEWENLFSYHISNKRLILKLYKGLIQPNSKKKKKKLQIIQFKNGQRT